MATGRPNDDPGRPRLVQGHAVRGGGGGAIGRGLEQGGWQVELCPVADGGEGTLEVLLGALGGELVTVSASDPLGRQIEAAFGVAEGPGSGRVAVVETAAASGLGLLAGDELDPLGASTAGTGELILAAALAGAAVIYVGVGGSATTDGGVGAIHAIEEGGGLGTARLVVLSDVRTPFEAAARVYGPQKGADGGDVGRLTRRLHALARGFDRDPRGNPDDRRRRGPVGRPVGAVRRDARPRRGVRARPARLRPADACRARGRHRRGAARSAEPCRQGRLRGRDPRPTVRRSLPRDRRRAASSTRSAPGSSTYRRSSRPGHRGS